jgi:hypothetical protein
MKSVRMILALLALSALPFVAVAAQGRGQEESTKCNADQAAAVARARAAGLQVPAGLAKKNCAQPVPPPAPVPPPPPPPSEVPPSGIHRAWGIVYEDIDGNGDQDMFAGEMGLAGWTVELYWNGLMIGSRTTGADGSFSFDNVGVATYSVCVIAQGGYNRTEPAAGNACGGAGYDFHVLDSPFVTWYERNFGMMLQ